MSGFLAFGAAAILSCGLSATPLGEKPTDGTIPGIEGDIPKELADSLNSGSPPPAKLRFADSRELLPEWVIGIDTDPAKGNLLARLSHDIFGYKVRFGWAEADPGTDGVTSFEETSVGTCRIKDAGSPVEKAP